MKRYSLIGLLTVLVAVTVWGSIIEVPEAPARMTAVVVGGGGGAAGGVPAGTLLLGINSTTGLTTGVFNGNTNTAYPMCHTGQATASIAHAYFYDDIGAETDPVHICVWNSSGTLLGCSGAITMTGATGWRTVAWSGPAITSATSYFIGTVSGTTTGFWTMADNSSPSMPGTTTTTAMTYGSEGNLGSGDGQTCGSAVGNYAIYVTN